MRIALLYAVFAALATAANIGAQDMWLRWWHGPYTVTLSVLAGTAVGLVVKYMLDKRYIFRFKAQSAAHDGKTFALYTLMGVLTTVIFWGFEFGFHAVFGTREMRYLGGALGLAIGYLAKYQLDKHFVFRAPTATAPHA
ncbi:GtrA family protein [Ottowia testudinis]|uniref:GtrA family protein n=1 Tax=Ottowia testudinis TaxID=2816950 RepID=A0A975CIN9_9BURK|nr:GtrA family protein [Ottowia testudinis]QTD47045.1 GtrA family protein [Ottowia testudinis]